ncbi:DNA primase, eukaryotic-type, small subunit, putative family protein [Trichomonas vaginalis G3]|uniref:DNA primase n=1 Tax=Trichomonas vaginalis (strain ATCC PRA-98 / G3) TaxID=412133 RepID=A2G330_TRIV3|nr:DNA primase, eukaryotic-type, small subunit family protein [Trichomonas vaginalis G3]EAX88441.1 DNA primase, eukaryotic-type, small subunit, putative family protein [Trichomonas vaginalis G3]KAI5535273.1 DNA primase protein [Trichomonas vaginalis G3]|eukprot:XP_001301371.1 DNA primase, eukaryotic-type, small subunit family protein [Trichomonas vaginalis G3]
MSVIDEELLRKYYSDKFPLEDIKQWISYGGNEPLENRECGFFFDDEKFMRWQTVDVLRRLALANPPQRMEIGPVYTHPIAIRQQQSPGEFRPKSKELIFDLDADDFKDIKCCCGDSEICEKCWPYMHCAIDCLTTILRTNFGFKKIFPVFSGRRGIHIWVCDKKARELSAAVRDKIVHYLNLKEITEMDNFLLNASPLLKQMLPSCEKYFCKIYRTQNIFKNQKTSERAYKLLGSETIKQINKIIDSTHGTDEERWESVKTMAFKGKTFAESDQYKRLIVFYSFPRLDENVTKGMNHLLKSPFSVHPKSGFISVPIPPEKYELLPQTWVPSFEKLMKNEPEAVQVFEESKRLLKEHASKPDE